MRVGRLSKAAEANTTNPGAAGWGEEDIIWPRVVGERIH
jgi:hypothetical protein